MQIIIFLIIALIFIVIAYLVSLVLTKFIITKLTTKSYLKAHNYLNLNIYEKYGFNEEMFNNFDQELITFKLNNLDFNIEVWTRKDVVNKDFDNVLTLMFDLNNRRYKAYKYICLANKYNKFVCFDSISYQGQQNLSFDNNTYKELFKSIGSTLNIQDMDIYINGHFTPLIVKSLNLKLIKNIYLENTYFNIHDFVSEYINKQLPTLNLWQMKIVIKIVTKKLSKNLDYNPQLSLIANKICKLHILNNNYQNLEQKKIVCNEQSFEKYVNENLFK